MIFIIGLFLAGVGYWFETKRKPTLADKLGQIGIFFMFASVLLKLWQVMP